MVLIRLAQRSKGSYSDLKVLKPRGEKKYELPSGQWFTGLRLNKILVPGGGLPPTKTRKEKTMTKKVKKILVGLLLLVAAGCTENQRAKNFGGTMTLDLPAGQKLVVATWKEDHLWYLTRPAHQGEQPETLTFQENSSYGIMQGTVIFKEH